MFNNLLKSGWLHALFIGVVYYPIGSITQKIVASYPDSNILVYTFFMMLSSACALLLIAGPGELVVRTLRRPETWIYTVLQILVLVFGLSIMKLVSATEGVGLYRIAGLFTLLLSALFLHQKMNKSEFVGGIFILTGVCLIVQYVDLPISAKFLLIGFIIGRALSQSTQKMITEIHKTNRKANNFKSQVRVTAFIMFAGSVMFAIILLLIAYAKMLYPNENILSAFPNFIDFLNIRVYVLAVFLGLFIVSIAKYCEFYAGKTIGAKYLTTIISLQIIFVYFAEKSLGYVNVMETIHLQSVNFIALALILLGNFVISLSGFFNNFKFIKKGEIQDTLSNLDDRFVDSQRDFDLVRLNLNSLLTLYDNKSKELSEDMEIDKITLENIINYDLEDIKLPRKTAKKINEFASHNVALKDKLTKAYNRYYLDNRVKELKGDEVEFNLYYLDLNKFKPINDTYGHEVGDIVLIETVKRLRSIKEFKESIFRVGGDEFVLIQFDNIENDLSQTIKAKIEEPITYNDEKLGISTSIGLVASKQYSNLQEMLATADKLMYKDKNDKER